MFESLFPLSFSRIELSIFFLAQVLGLGLDNILSESDEELKIHGLLNLYFVNCAPTVVTMFPVT